MAKQRDPVNHPTLPVYATRLAEGAGEQQAVTLIVPATDVLLTTVTLPKLGRHRLMQALPFALEDQLIEDVAQLHFAIGDRQPDGSWPVAVMAKTRMQEWLEKAAAAGLSLARMVPEIFTLPVSEGHWTVDFHDTDCVVRTGVWSGFGCHRDNLAAFLESALLETATRPECIHLRFFSNASDIALPDYSDITFNRIFLAPFDQAIKAKETMASLPILNLLQNEWQPTGSGSPTRKIWRIAAGLAALALAIAFISNLFILMTLQHEASHLHREIYQIYHRNFPTATSMVAPKTRMTEKLKGLTQQSGSFLGLLAKTAQPLSTEPDVRLEWMDYQNHQLRLGLSATSFSSIDSLIRTLSATGLAIKQQNANTTNGSVKATLLVRSHV